MPEKIFDVKPQSLVHVPMVREKLLQSVWLPPLQRMMATFVLDEGQKLVFPTLETSLVSEGPAGLLVEHSLIQLSNNSDTWILCSNLIGRTQTVEKEMYLGEVSEVTWVNETKPREISAVEEETS